MLEEDPDHSDLSAAMLACPISSWVGSVWRFHSRKYAGDDATGSLLFIARYNRGSDQYTEVETWPVLYTALAPHIALGERVRHLTPTSLSRLAQQRLSHIRVSLSAIWDFCAPGGCADLGLDELDGTFLCHPTNYDLCHRLAQHARDRAEAMRIPSCTRFPEGNLIIFPDRLKHSSSVVVEQMLDPELFLDPDTP